MGRYKLLVCVSLTLSWLMFVHISSTAAHALDVAYLDFSRSTSSASGWNLTVALQPYQAFELVRAGRPIPFDIRLLQKRGDLISAYAQEHVSVKSAGVPCAWEPASARIPMTELEAIGEGVTVSANLACSNMKGVFDVESSLFLEGFPQQTSIVRLERAEEFVELLILNKVVKRGRVLVDESLKNTNSSNAISEEQSNIMSYRAKCQRSRGISRLIFIRDISQLRCAPFEMTSQLVLRALTLTVWPGLFSSLSLGWLYVNLS